MVKGRSHYNLCLLPSRMSYVKQTILQDYWVLFGRGIYALQIATAAVRGVGADF